MTGAKGNIHCHDLLCEYNSLNSDYAQSLIMKVTLKSDDKIKEIWGYCGRIHKGERIIISQSRFCFSGNPSTTMYKVKCREHGLNELPTVP